MFKNFSSQTKILSYIYHKQEQDSPPPQLPKVLTVTTSTSMKFTTENPDG